MRETGIFTGTTNSPSHSLRQSHDRYAIRAGRNLPDKEFRSVLSHSVSREAGLYLSHPVFIVAAMARISSMPSTVRCLPLVISCRTFLNLMQSVLFFDFSGCLSKNGTITFFR